MGKVGNKRPNDKGDRRHPKKPVVIRRTHRISKAIGNPPRSSPATNQRDGKRKAKGNDPPRPRGKVPFKKGDRILLVGEGDFSFSLSLAQNLNVDLIVATSYDVEESLYKKYPHAKEIITTLHGTESHKVGEAGESDEFVGFSPPSSQPPASEDNLPRSTQALNTIHPSISTYHGIDATKLSKTHRKMVRRHGPFTKIVFNFPHVGGLSTDVNRQTRANQALIQAFFGGAKEHLAGPENPIWHPKTGNEDTENEEDYSPGKEDEETASPPPVGQILVTLFEGEAYTDWNIRDIARDQGLRVVESFRFPWEAYPGYRHARTIGEVVTGKDRSSEGKRKGAWRGEEREARCFVFEINGEDGGQVVGKKRKKPGDDSESD